MRPAFTLGCFLFVFFTDQHADLRFAKQVSNSGDKVADSEEPVAAPACEAPPELTPEESAPVKSSSELLEEIFDAFLTTSSGGAVVVADKKKKSSSKHKKKKKHKDKKKHKEKKSKRSRRSSSADAFYEAGGVEVIGAAVDADARRCDLLAAGELDSEEEKALSFDCFVERPDTSSQLDAGRNKFPI